MTAQACNHLEKFQYKVNNVWNDVEIKSSETINNVNVYTIEIPANSEGRITAIRFLDKNGNVAGQREENIYKKADKSLIVKIKIYADEGSDK